MDRRSQWIFILAILGTFSVLAFGLDITPPHKKQGQIAAPKKETPQAMLAPFIDSLTEKVLTAEEQTRLKKLATLPSQAGERYERLSYFWRDSVSGVGMVPAYFYLGEWGMVDSSEGKIARAGNFFLGLLDMAREEEWKVFFAKIAAYYVQAALSLQPENDSLAISLATTQLYAGQAMEGVKTLKENVEKNPQNVYALKSLANAYLLRTGKREDAIALFEHALGIAPQDTEIILSLAAVYERAGKIDKATQLYTALLRRKPPMPKSLEAFLKNKLSALDKRKN